MDNRAVHERWMRRCLELAQQALITGDAAVGALVVRADEVLGEGVESVKGRLDVTAHAEIVALRQASARMRTVDLTGATLYTTVEPCVMCAYAIRLARVTLVVAGTRSADGPLPLSGASVLRDAAALPARPPVILVSGVLEEDCRVLHRGRGSE